MIDSTINDCWNTIGIWSDKSNPCPKLETLIHCYNCPVYSNAGRQLLDRKPDNEYISEWKQNLSKPRSKSDHDLKSALAFRLGNEWFALPTGIIREITQCDKHHSLPHRKNRILRGLVNVRGELLLSVSLGYLFNLNRKELEAEPKTPIHERYIVISKNEDCFAFPVSEVKDTINYEIDKIQNAPSTISDGASNYISGIIEHNDLHIGLLDTDLVFDSLTRNIS